MFVALRNPFIGLLLVCFVLGGCASKYGAQTTVVNYYPQCYNPIESLRQAEKQFESTVATSAIVGTFVGALAGFLATGDARGAAIGAAAGAVSGAALGYANAKSQEYSDTNQRMASYLRDLDGDIRGLNEVTASARMALQCYDKQFQDALAEYKGNAITRAELDARYNEIVSGTQEAERIMGVALASAGDRNEEYQAAVNYEQEEEAKGIADGTRVAAAPAPKPVAKKAPAKKAMAKKAPAKKAMAKKAPAKKAVVVAKAPPAPLEVIAPEPVEVVEPTVAGFATQTQNYQASSQALENEKIIAATMQASWDADLAALSS